MKPRPRSPILILASLTLMAAASAQAQSRHWSPPTHVGAQPPPSSAYADGTGNSDIDRLNSGQLDQNYTGPWHVVQPAVPAPGMMAPPPAPPPPAPPPASPPPPSGM